MLTVYFEQFSYFHERVALIQENNIINLTFKLTSLEKREGMMLSCIQQLAEIPIYFESLSKKLFKYVKYSYYVHSTQN